MIALLLIAFIGSIFATYGIDISYYSGDVSTSTFSCIRNNGYSFLINQAQIGSTYNGSAPGNFWNAKNAGISIVDFYIYPSSTTGADGVRQTIRNLKNAGVLGIGNTVWIDVEACNNWYGSDYDSNAWFIRSCINAAIDELDRGHVGVYANWYQWESCFGGRYNVSEYGDLQLWYPHYDDWLSFNDFQSFGGWSWPNMKQYAGDQWECGLDIDRSFY